MGVEFGRGAETPSARLQAAETLRPQRGFFWVRSLLTPSDPILKSVFGEPRFVYVLPEQIGASNRKDGAG